MKRIIASLIAFIMITMSLVSCDWFNFNKSGDPKDNYDGTVYSDSVAVKVVKPAGAEGYVNVAYLELEKKLADAGADASRGDDASEQNGSEIAIGATNRAASQSAKAIVDSKHQSGNISFAIVYKSGVLALYGADESSLAEAVDYFVLYYLKPGELKVESDHSYSISMNSEEYERYLSEKAEAELLANWDNRFDYLSEYISDGAIGELKLLYKTLYDEHIYMWLANLWDDETGAFYYACSSRDYKGYLPDIESTTQALKIIAGSGMLNKYGSGLNALDAAIPEDMQQKILNFIFSLYEEEDGYFYHEQWGTAISDDRKGRDLTWSMQLVNYFNASLPEGWEDAVTRLNNKNKVNAVASVLKSSVSATASDNRFASKENFKNYLDSLNILSNSYGKGHQLASQADQIKAAGLIDYCCDYLDALQRQVFEEQEGRGETPTGLWDPDLDYDSISGFFKLAVVYSSAGRAQNYLDYVVRSCISCIVSDEPATQVVYVYNPWAAIGECVSGMNRANNQAKANGKSAPYDVDAVREELYDMADELFEKTLEKAKAFRKDDGGYSYNLGGSAATIQGVPASLGFAEGDVNATCLLVYHMIGYMESAFGFEMPDIWNITDFEKFMTELEGVEPIQKQGGDGAISKDFEEYDFDSTIADGSVIADAGTSIKVVSDPDDDSNKVLYLNSAAGKASGYKINPLFTERESCLVFEADINVLSKSSGTTHQISFYNNGQRYYMLTFGGGKDSVSLGDASNVSSVGGAQIINTSFGTSIATGEWFKLRVELYENVEDGFAAKIYVNEEYVYTSTNYFGKELGEEPKNGSLSSIWFYNLISPSAELMIDNLEVYYEDIPYEEGGSGSDRESYDFESQSLKVSANMRSENGTAHITSAASPSGAASNVYHVSKVSTSSWDQISFKLPTEREYATTLTYSMDIKFNSYNGGIIQLAIGSLDPNAYYLLGLNGSGTGFGLFDVSTMKAGVVPQKNNYGGNYSAGEWHNITIELDISDEASGFEARIYVDEEYVATSVNYYDYNGDGAAPNLKLDAVNLRFVSATLADVYIDNVIAYYE